MIAYRAPTRPPSVSGVIDLLLGPATIALALLLSMLLIPVRVHAQTVGGAAADFAYQRSMSRIVAGSAAGLQVSSPTTMNILNAGKVVGSFAVTEKRLIDLATLAKYARASTIPGIIALAGTELVAYGLEKCADGTWCTRQSNKPNGSNVDWGSTGWMTVGGASCTSYNCSAETACRAATNIANGKYPLLKFITLVPGETARAYCYARNAAGDALSEGAWGVIQRQGSYVDPPGSLVSATDANIETAWKGAFQAKPFLQEKVWGFEDQTTQNQQWADALAQLATVAAPNTVTVADPTTSTITPTGTTKMDRSCTYAASGNASASTQKEQPVSVGVTCTTTTTNPDGTTKTETTTTDPAPKGAPSAPLKVEVETCGLPGKPACKMDETGTKTDDDVAQASKAATQVLEQAKTDNSTMLDGKMTEVDQRARDASAHWIKLFNLLPTFGSEICNPPTIVDSATNQTLTFDICPHYYMAKDVFAVFISLGFLVSLAFDVRDAIKT